MKTPARYFFYSHDGLGLGHTRRNLAIASALAKHSPDAAILIATGTNEVHRLGLPDNVSVLKIPGLRKLANDRYQGRRLHLPADELFRLRSSLLKAAVKSFRPDVMLVDKHPLGASGELRAALNAHTGKTVLGLRDVLDAPATVLNEWERYELPGRIAEYYDRVLIYGQQNVFDSVREYAFSPALAERTRFCGYVVHAAERQERNGDAPPPELAKHPVVLATAGGGEDGFHLLQIVAKAAAGAPWRAIVVAGPLAGHRDCRSLERLCARNGAAFYHFVHHLDDCLTHVDALVCMGGYNTLVEALTHRAPTVCVPRVTPRTEQLIRAEAFARLGMLNVLPPPRLTADALRATITDALAVSRRSLARRVNAVMKFDGAQQAAQSLLRLARTPVNA